MSPAESRLRRLLARLSRRERERPSIEEALLGGRFLRYALRRLTLFASARLVAAMTCALEYLVLAELFSDRAMVVSLSLANVTFVLDSVWWGALESLRRALRLGRERREREGERAALERWLTSALWLSGLGVLGLAAWRANAWRHGQPLTLLDAYSAVCVFRLGCDVVLQTLHAGVWAHHRVRRPLAWVLVLQPLGFLVTLALGPRLGNWAFPVAALASMVAARAVYVVYLVRAYRVDRQPLPRLRLRWTHSRLLEPPSLMRAALGGLAQLSGRIGTVLVIATLLPSLATRGDDDDGGSDPIDPWALALHLAGPLLQGAASWAMVFYHDLKRLDSDAAELLRRRLFARLVATALLMGVAAWAASAAAMPLLGVRLPWGRLLPLFVALALSSLAQLWSFARGALARLLVGSLVTAAVLYHWRQGGHRIDETWLAAASAGGALVTLGLVLAGIGRQRWGLYRRESDFRRTLARRRRPVRVGLLQAPRANAAALDELTTWLATRLGRRGGAVRRRGGVVWFAVGNAGPGAGELASAAAGLATRLDLRAPTPGAEAARQLAAPVPSADDALARFRAAHSDGVVADLRARPPAWLTALSPDLRRELWRDAVAAAGGARARASRLGVSVLLEDGRIRHLLVAGLPRSLAEAAALRATQAVARDPSDRYDPIDEPRRSVG